MSAAQTAGAMKLTFTFIFAALAGVLLLTMAGCALQRVIPTETTVLQHGPFEIVATGRRISSGGFPNTSGNPFATREVTSFTVRWRGQAVDVQLNIENLFKNEDLLPYSAATPGNVVRFILPRVRQTWSMRATYTF